MENSELLHFVCCDCLNNVREFCIFKRRVNRSFKIAQWVIEEKINSEVSKANCNSSDDENADEIIEYKIDLSEYEENKNDLSKIYVNKPTCSLKGRLIALINKYYIEGHWFVNKLIWLYWLIIN